MPLVRAAWFSIDIISLIIYSIYLRKCYLSVYMNRTARDGWYDFYSYNLLMGSYFSKVIFLLFQVLM